MTLIKYCGGASANTSDAMGFDKICGCSQQQVMALLYALGNQGEESGVVSGSFNVAVGTDSHGPDRRQSRLS